MLGIVGEVFGTIGIWLGIIFVLCPLMLLAWRQVNRVVRRAWRRHMKRSYCPHCPHMQAVQQPENTRDTIRRIA